MQPERIAVFLPCHSLDDFPTWLEEQEADELLAAWTAAWHPALIAAIGTAPGWASVEAPPYDAATLLGIVPAACDERFSAMRDMAGLAGSQFVRQVRPRDAIVAAATAALAESGLPIGGSATLVEDFHALGLARLLAELLARRMRSSLTTVADDFATAVVAAARAAVAGDEAVARERLRECFATLEATRSHYYPVDVWLLDLVLLADTTLGGRLAGELDTPVPCGLVATGRLLERLGREDPALLARLRDRIAAGTVELVGCRDDATPVDLQSLDSLAASLDRGQATCRALFGVAPVTFGQCTGGSSAFLPRLLVDRGYQGAIWNLFDGTPLPAAGSSRIRWQGHDGGCVEAGACTPLDARAAGTILQLAEKIGDAMDHHHTCILEFAHHAGTASPWFGLLRRIASWTSLLGRFVTPATLFAETAHAGTPAAFSADDFPPTLPLGTERDLAAEIDERVAATVREACAEGCKSLPLADSLPRRAGRPARAAARPPGFVRRLVGCTVGSGCDQDRLVLDNGAVRVAVHPRSGGLLSLRATGGRSNRLSQELALRTTRPEPPVGAAWETAEERAEYSRMIAERIDRDSDSSIVSRGALVSGAGTPLGSFTQRLELVGDLPLVRLTVGVSLSRPLAGPLFETYATCRFAWNENDDIDLSRSLHGESIVTERTRFTAPHFLELSPVGGRSAAERVLIATGGLPWHVRSTPHTVDVILTAAGADRVARQLALGLGIEAPRPVALAVLRERAGDTTAGKLP